jgi:hypothetical protein
MLHGRLWIPWLVCILAIPVYGQPAPTSAPSAELAAPYTDGSFGFSITPFAGATTYRQKRMTGVSDVEVVQFADIDRRWSLSVRVSDTTQPLDVETIIEGITANIAARYPDVQVRRGEPARVDGREAVRYEAVFSHQGDNWLRQQAVVRTRPTQYFALVYVTPAEHRDVARPLFERIVASFKIIRNEAQQKVVEQALERGVALLRKAAGREFKLSEKVIPESYMRFVVEGREIGFVQIQERVHEHDGLEGIEIAEWAWMFNPDGSTTHLRHTMFLTNDLTFEQWENRVYTLPAETPGQTRHMIYQLDNALRQDDHLIVAAMPEPNSPELRDRVFEVEPTYASAAWMTLMPRLIDLKKPQIYAFSAYDNTRRGMILRTIEVLGSRTITLGAQRVPTTHIQDSEGLVPPISDIDVDSKGRILRVVSGPLEMIATTKQEIEKRYLKRVADTLVLFRKFPVQEPRPMPHDRERDNERTPN